MAAMTSHANALLMYTSDVYLHDCTSRPHPLHIHSHVFLCFHEVDWFHSQIFVFVIDRNVCLKKNKCKAGGTRPHCWACNCSKSKATLASVHNVEGTT